MRGLDVLHQAADRLDLGHVHFSGSHLGVDNDASAIVGRVALIDQYVDLPLAPADVLCN